MCAGGLQKYLRGIKGGGGEENETPQTEEIYGERETEHQNRYLVGIQYTQNVHNAHKQAEEERGAAENRDSQGRPTPIAKEVDANPAASSGQVAF